MELNGEFLRKQDLKRWGILQSTIKQMGTEVIAGSSDLKPDGTPVVPAAKTPFAPSNVTVTALYQSRKQYFRQRLQAGHPAKGTVV